MTIQQFKGTRKLGAECSQSPCDHSDNRSVERILSWFAIFCRRRFIYANGTKDNGKTDWRTAKSQEALTPQQLYQRWQSSDELIGVRFWKDTEYLALDVDFGSKYHPVKDGRAIAEILGYLESIGLCRYLIVRSSNSQGLHIYFPLPDRFILWRVALLVKTTLENAGFEIKPGQLEIFPRYIPFIPGYKPDYTGHRLPLQIGSYLLGDDFQIETNDLETFISRWYAAAAGQDLETWQQSLAAVKPPKMSLKDPDVQEWRDRLERTLKTGWTGRGQTQTIAKDACIYGRVFERLSWCELETFVLNALTTAPGYQKFCRHQRNIKRVARDWVKTNRKSNRYYPLYSKQTEAPKIPTGPSNQQKQQQAEQKIREAIAQMVAEEGGLLMGNRARAHRIHEISRCSLSTIYKYRDLWDSEHLPSCVTPCCESAVDDLAIAPVTSHPLKSPVTAQPVRTLEVCNSLYKVAQSQSGQDVTHDGLLSIYSCLSSSGELEREQKCASPPLCTPAAAPQHLELSKTLATRDIQMSA